jgi:ribosomal 50S subunit-associated protein YjgA (DUF615 family)
MKRIKNLFKRKRHLNYVKNYLHQLQFDTINTVIKAEVESDWSKEITKHLNNNAVLIRKYQRRLKWLTF